MKTNLTFKRELEALLEASKRTKARPVASNEAKALLMLGWSPEIVSVIAPKKA